MTSLSERISALALQDEQLLREALEALKGLEGAFRDNPKGGEDWKYFFATGIFAVAVPSARATITKLEERLLEE